MWWRKYLWKLNSDFKNNFGPIMIQHRPELACSAMCEFWWNWVMLRTIPSKVCINVLTSPCSLYTFWFNGDDRTSFKAIGTPWRVRVVCKWSHSIIYPIYYKSTLYDNQKWCSNLKSSILQLYMTLRYDALFWNVQILQLHFYTDKVQLFWKDKKKIEKKSYFFWSYWVKTTILSK